ncbi:MAG: roadblock/LC7 domain-containing protein [Gemmatimonadota bacterium]|nr:roadblock/LC7 domain-containing protein [Gemmatimonadota bacterium]
MPTLRELTEAVQNRPGVESVVILGADGLLIETHDSAQSHAEAIAARVPAVATAATQLGGAAGAGSAGMGLLEFDRGYGVFLRLSDQVLLFVCAGPSVDLSGLLYDLRRHRTAMAALV